MTRTRIPVSTLYSIGRYQKTSEDVEVQTIDYKVARFFSASPSKWIKYPKETPAKCTQVIIRGGMRMGREGENTHRSMLLCEENADRERWERPEEFISSP
jgi:hypothetical protein